MQTLITGCTDPFAAEMRYHPACWRKYISNTKDEVEDLRYQNVHVQKAKQFFFNHAKNVIFEENEPRNLEGLLEDYNKLLENYNFKRCERSLLLKEMLQKEFGQSIGFHNRFQKNKSCIVFDVSKGYTYVEAAINFWSISEDDMLTLLPLGFFGVRIPGGRGTKCSLLYNSRTKYGNLMKLCRPIV